MARNDSVFERHEKKYMMGAKQAEAVRRELKKRMDDDPFGAHTVMSLYFDTPDRRLIRRSMEKPVYREKLRIRCYGVPSGGDRVYAELKKKFKGVSYKRRTPMTLERAMRFLSGGDEEPQNQIEREIACLVRRNAGMAPAMLLSYEREAYFGRDGEASLRITIDKNILWRDRRLDAALGAWGTPLIEGGQYLMEVKAAGALPLWLSHLLDGQGLYPTGFSKYAAAYEASALLSARGRGREDARSA